MNKVGLFHMGPPKTGTTWLYKCLKEHPQISASISDTVHYFDMHYHRSTDWYHEQFLHENDRKLKFDPTPSYICSPTATERIATYNENAKLIICLRHPIDRAFSHWWHLRKTEAITLSFEDILKNYNSFSTWLEHGFVSVNLQKILSFFGRDNLHVIDFDEMNVSPQKTIKEVCQFANIDSDFEPSLLNKKVNAAGSKKGPWTRLRYKAARTLFGEEVHNSNSSNFVRWMSGKTEYLDGVPKNLREQLLEMTYFETREVEKLLQIDLEKWRV